MDYDSVKQSKSNILGLIGMFLVLTILGSLLSGVYILGVQLIPSIYLSVFLAIFLGAILAGLVSRLIKAFKITNLIGSGIVVILSLLIIHYIKWNFYFVFLTNVMYYSDMSIFEFIPLVPEILLYYLKDYTTFIPAIQDLNTFGTWSIESSNYTPTGIVLWIIWGVEFLIISVPALFACSASKDPFIFAENKWAYPIYLDYYFEKFDSSEKEDIKNGNLRTIVNKPLATVVKGTVSQIAIFTLRAEHTGYICLYERNKNGKMKRASNPIFVGVKESQQLEEQLQALHRPKVDEVVDHEPTPVTENENSFSVASDVNEITTDNLENTDTLQDDTKNEQ